MQVGCECSQAGVLDHTELYSYGFPGSPGHHIRLQVRTPPHSHHGSAGIMALQPS